MISDDMRKRIAALNRRDLKHELEVSESEHRPVATGQKNRGNTTTSFRTPVPDARELRVMATAADARLHLSLSEVAQGQAIQTPAGAFLRIDQTVREILHGGGRAFAERYVRVISTLHAGNVPWDRYDTFHPLIDAHARDVICVDIETTGLTAGTPLFLIGILAQFNGELRVIQLLARDYTEEAALLTHFAALLDASSVIISFNGKSYDLPYIRDRCAFLGVPFCLRQAHIDMLHVARRLWGRQLPNCKLQTLERHLCHRIRRGDIPGAEIPDAYHRFVLSGNAVQMRDILFHNALDLLTTTEVMLLALESGKP